MQFSLISFSFTAFMNHSNPTEVYDIFLLEILQELSFLH